MGFFVRRSSNKPNDKRGEKLYYIEDDSTEKRGIPIGVGGAGGDGSLVALGLALCILFAPIIIILGLYGKFLIGFLFANAQEIDKFKIFRIVFVIICAVWFTVAVTAVALFAIAQSDSYMLVYMGLCVGNVALVISSIAITAKMCRANDISIW